MSAWSKLPWDTQLEMIKKLPTKDVLSFCALDSKHRDYCWNKRGARFLLDPQHIYDVPLKYIAALSSDPGWKVLAKIYGPNLPLWEVTENLFYDFRTLVEDKDQDRAFRKYLSAVIENSNIAKNFGREEKFWETNPDELRATYRALKELWRKSSADYPESEKSRASGRKWDLALADKYLKTHGKAMVRSLLRQTPLEEELEESIKGFL
jgi:hypothetical protein